MSKWVSRIYGIILLWLALETLWFNIVPDEFLVYLVIAMGGIILLTPIRQGAISQLGLAPRPKFQWIRRYVFGIVIIYIGLASLIQVLNDLTPFLTLGSGSGAAIFVGIAVIYFLSSFKSRNLKMHSF